MDKKIVLKEFYGEEEILKNLVGATITGASFLECEDAEEQEYFGETIDIDLEKNGKKMYLSFNSQGCWHYGEDS